MKFLRHESYRVGVALSTGLNIGAKGLAFVVNIIVAAVFGVGEQTDVYYFCLGTAMSFVLFVTSIDSSVVIPELMRMREQISAESGRRVATLFFVLYLAVGCAVSLVVFIDPVLVIGGISGFSRSVLTENRDMILLFLLALPLMILTTYLLDVLASRKMFSLPMIASLINSLVIVLSISLFRGRLGMRSVALGLVAGYGVQTLLLVILSRHDLRLRDWQVRGVLHRTAYQNIGWAQAGNFATFLSTYIPLVVLSGFGNGAVTALSYGQKLADVPSQLLTVQVSSVVGIRFNELAARREEEAQWDVYVKVVATLLLILIPTSAFLFLNRTSLLGLVFGRGAFDLSAQEKTSAFFQYLCFLAPLVAINTVSARLLMARQMIREALGYQIVLSVLTVGCTYLFTSITGPTGYALALLIVFGISAVGVRWLFRFLFRNVRYDEVLRTFALATLLAGGATLIAAGTLAVVPPLPMLWSMAASGLLLYGGFAGMLLLVDRHNEISRSLVWALHTIGIRKGNDA